MEETTSVPETAPVTPLQESVTPPPAPIRTAKPKRTKTFLGIFALIVFIVGGFLIFREGKSGETKPSPTPLISTEGVLPEESVTPAPTAAPVNKAKISFEIKNGTGISGEAAYLQSILKALGYAKFSVGNAETQDYVTTAVTFVDGLEQVVQDEITAKLQKIYKEVDAKTSATQKSDVVIIVGLKIGATAKPSATPTPVSSPTPTASPSATPAV